MIAEAREVRRTDLPALIPILPLSGVLLLPGGRLPLNIFEPRYLNMTRDAITGPRAIGMIQPRVRERQDPDDRPDIYGTGCLGRIEEFAETDDGRIVLTLAGQCRFDVVRELALENGYRRVEARYNRFLADLSGAGAGAVDRDRLLVALRRYFAAQGIEAEWSAIEKAPDDGLITTLAMVCPFAPAEKQAILESPDLGERAEIVTTLMEMALVEGDGGGGTHGH